MPIAAAVFRLLRPTVHEVSIEDVWRNGRVKPFAPYFEVVCSCGWVETADTEEQARASADRHSAEVSEPSVADRQRSTL